jgi:predicted alpha/beta-hydrolase family hydrolase
VKSVKQSKGASSFVSRETIVRALVRRGWRTADFQVANTCYRRAQGAKRKPQQLETAEDLARGPSLRTCVSKNTLYLA